MIKAQNPELQPFLREEYDLASLEVLRKLLFDQKKTIAFSPLASGLFSATLVTKSAEETGYHAAWVRDNVHIAHAHLVGGEPAVAAGAARALCKFFAKEKARFETFIDPPRRAELKKQVLERINQDIEKMKQDRPDMTAADLEQTRVGMEQTWDRMERPHIRFDGDKEDERNDDWDHAQNDALGYFLWLYAQVVLHPLGSNPHAAPLIPPETWEADLKTVALFPKYLEAIQYWQDKDSGHWEESRKVSASSIGAVVAGLRMLLAWHDRAEEITEGHERSAWNFLAKYYYQEVRAALPRPLLTDLVSKGEKALLANLPEECHQGPKGEQRQYDAALLFLVYPLEVIDGPLARLIVAQTLAHLRGDIGIKRYVGDSYYCTDYEHLMAKAQDKGTRNFSQDMRARNALLQDGGEAQWCLFDPIVSVYYGRRYLASGAPEDLARQTEYLNRSLAQITKEDLPRCAAFRCPELYYHEQGKLQTSKSTPLLWTQANLWLALNAMRASLSASPQVRYSESAG